MNFRQFLGKIENFDLVKKHAERTNRICGVEMDNLFGVPFWEVKQEIPKLINDGEIERAIHKVIVSEKNITFGKVKDSDNYEKAKFFFWMLDQYEVIAKLEETKLMSNPDPDLSAAGVDKLNVLESFNIIDNIAHKYSYTHAEAKELTYDTVFSIQLKEKIEREINKKLSEIKRKKRNRK